MSNLEIETWRHADGTVRLSPIDAKDDDYFGPAPMWKREMKAYEDAKADYYDSDRFDPSCW